jgi:hypothetical protein
LLRGDDEPNGGHPGPAPQHRPPQLLLLPQQRIGDSPQSAAIRAVTVRASAETMATEKLGIKVERNPPESRLSELGVRQWPT